MGRIGSQNDDDDDANNARWETGLGLPREGEERPVGRSWDVARRSYGIGHVTDASRTRLSAAITYRNSDWFQARSGLPPYSMAPGVSPPPYTVGPPPSNHHPFVDTRSCGKCSL